MFMAFCHKPLCSRCRFIFRQVSTSVRGLVSSASACVVDPCNGLGNDGAAGEERCDEQDEHPDLGYSTYVSLLQQYSNSKDLFEGKRVHERLVKCGYSIDKFLGNFLVQMYGNCGSLEDAQRTFESIEQRNVISWNIMVTAYARNGHLDMATDLLDKMPSCSTVSWNAMITAYVQNGDLQNAKSMFDKMPRPNVITWTTLISGYTQYGYYKEALQLFRCMGLEGVHPDRITFIGILHACVIVRNGMLIHASIIESGLETDPSVASALVTMYGRTHSLDSARRVFDRTPQRNVVLWNAMTTGYAQNGYLESARSMFEKMAQRDVVSWTALFAALGQHGHLDEAREMFDEMPHRNLVSWNALIAAYAQNGYGDRALEIFRAMDLEGVQADETTFVSVLDACACLKTPKEGKIIHAEFVDNGFLSDIKVETALINLYGKCGSLECARSIFERMKQRNFVSWNAMIGAYAQNGHIKDALELFHSMNLDGINPNEVTFVTILGACSHAGLMESGLEYFLSFIQDQAIVPLMEHYVCMIDLLGRGGKLSEAEELINEMPFEASLVAWTTLLGACRVHNDVKRGAFAAARVVELDSESDSPYVMLSNLYSATHDSAF